MTEKRIAVGGWQHETNTFATIKANYEAFASADEWPELGHGEHMLELVDGVHLPITGAIRALREAGCEVVPLCWCSATPSAHVTRHAFETISDMIVDHVRQALPLDGLYLDLHGAMVGEHVEDGEGELLRRVRAVTGPELPIAVSLDLHANVTPLMVEMATVLDVFRTYPHVDMGETGHRTATSLVSLVESGEHWHKACRQLGFVLPLNWGCTLTEPCSSIYRMIPGEIGGEVRSLAFASGFHLSDIHDIGPAVVGYGLTAEAARRVVDRYADYIESQRTRFHERFWSAEDGVARALDVTARQGGTVVLADTQDNPGGGGSGDTTGLLQAMVRQDARNAVFAVLSDGDTVARAEAAGVGARFMAELGGKSAIPGHSPYQVEVTVEKITDGHLVATGPMYRGARMALGPCARLSIDGIQVLVASKAVQTADQAIIRHFGIEPGDVSLLALKSSVHFRNDFTDLAREILVVESPGVVYANPARLTYRNIRPGMDLPDTLEAG